MVVSTPPFNYLREYSYFPCWPLPLPPPVSMDHTGIENFPFYYIPFLIISSLEKRHFLFLHSNLVTHVVTSYDSREKAFSALEWYEIN